MDREQWEMAQDKTLDNKRQELGTIMETIMPILEDIDRTLELMTVSGDSVLLLAAARKKMKVAYDAAREAFSNGG